MPTFGEDSSSGNSSISSSSASGSSTTSSGASPSTSVNTSAGVASWSSTTSRLSSSAPSESADSSSSRSCSICGTLGAVAGLLTIVEDVTPPLSSMVLSTAVREVTSESSPKRLVRNADTIAVSTRCPFWNKSSFNASWYSWAVAKRSSRSRANALRSTSLSPCSSFGYFLNFFSMSASRMLMRVSRSVRPRNRRLRVSDSKSTMPREKMSDRWSISSPLTCSGDMYPSLPRSTCLEPLVSCVWALATPKSMILTCPCREMMIFEGDTSRWMILRGLP